MVILNAGPWTVWYVPPYSLLPCWRIEGIDFLPQDPRDFKNRKSFSTRTYWHLLKSILFPPCYFTSLYSCPPTRFPSPDTNHFLHIYSSYSPCLCHHPSDTILYPPHGTLLHNFPSSFCNFWWRTLILDSLTSVIKASLIRHRPLLC